MKKIIIKEENIFFMSSPHKDMKYFNDDEVIEHLESALLQGWDVSEKYGNQYDYYNALHACAMNYHFKSATWLLKKGLDPNFRSGNDNTVFTFLLSGFNNSGVEVKDLLNFFEVLKKFGGNLNLSGYENQSPIILYSRYNAVLEDQIIDYLIKNADFENTFLLNEIFKDDKLCNIKNIKKILNYHNINLKKIEYSNQKNSETYWDSIAFVLKGKYYKKKYEVITWLENKLGFDLDSWHTYYDFDGKKESKYCVNLLGLAIQNKNDNMFEWILKRKPQYLNDVFYKDDEPYSLIEFSVMCDFRKGIKIALKNMTTEELNKLNISKLKDLCKNHDYSKITMETLKKTYTAIMYKNMMSKYDNSNFKNEKTKKLKI